jgi:sugar-specific transcriptional regulator TrmB
MTMSTEWDYQIRILLADAYATIAHEKPDDASLAPIADILARHRAALQSQYDAFAGYVEEAEREGPENYPLYKWTKATIEDPVKKAKHQKIFTLHVEGQEVYAKAKAEALEAELLPLEGGGLIEKVSKYDTNPENNPQAPAHLR